jgi:hypothetical protein
MQKLCGVLFGIVKEKSLTLPNFKALLVVSICFDAGLSK